MGHLASRDCHRASGAAEDHFDTIALDHLCHVLRRDIGLRLGVGLDQFDRPSQDSASGVDLLDGELRCPFLIDTLNPIWARNRDVEANLDRFLCIGRKNHL